MNGRTVTKRGRHYVWRDTFSAKVPQAIAKPLPVRRFTREEIQAMYPWASVSKGGPRR